MKEGKIDFVNNITRGLSNGGLFNDYTIRCSAIDLNIPLITNTRLASAFITAFSKIGIDDLEIKSMDEYL